MALRFRFAVAVCCIPFCGLLGGCKGKPKQPVIVHVLRNLRSPYGFEVDHRILDYQGSNPQLPSGQPVVIQSETGDYKEMLQKQTSGSEAVQLILLDSPDDAQANSSLQIALPNAVNICASVKACPANVPAIIPQQVSGEKRQAAQAFADYLQKAP